MTRLTALLLVLAFAALLVGCGGSNSATSTTDTGGTNTYTGGGIPPIPAPPLTTLPGTPTPP